ncbi:hypothetical protein PRNP1_012628 [Phytophthora ramorum]
MVKGNPISDQEAERPPPRKKAAVEVADHPELTVQCLAGLELKLQQLEAENKRLMARVETLEMQLRDQYSVQQQQNELLELELEAQPKDKAQSKRKAAKSKPKGKSTQPRLNPRIKRPFPKRERDEDAGLTMP